MYTFFLVLLILDALLLCLVVLLQSGKGGGLAAEFGGVSSSTDTFLGGRQTATLLTKMSWVTGGVFLGLAMILAILSSRAQTPGSVLEGQFGPTPQQQQQVPTPLLEQSPAEGDEAQPGADPSQTGADQVPIGVPIGGEGQGGESAPEEGGN